MAKHFDVFRFRDVKDENTTVFSPCVSAIRIDERFLESAMHKQLHAPLFVNA